MNRIIRGIIQKSSYRNITEKRLTIVNLFSVMFRYKEFWIITLIILLIVYILGKSKHLIILSTNWMCCITYHFEVKMTNKYSKYSKYYGYFHAKSKFSIKEVKTSEPLKVCPTPWGFFFRCYQCFWCWLNRKLLKGNI